TGSRRLENTVLLEDLRCDGSAHDGCQAECRLYWKEAWLRPAEPDQPASASPGTPEEIRALQERLGPHVRRVVEANGARVELHRCQATDLLQCTTRYALWEP